MININEPNISDQKERTESLDITQSFIVKAPAGSGKTTLLTQRFLALLAYAKMPEEILAITFTRKAAAEMRNRILNSLENVAANQNAPSSKLEELASLVLKKDLEKNWHLLENPHRLSILTFDALAKKIASSSPLTNPLSNANIVDNTTAEDCYAESYKLTINEILDDTEFNAVFPYLKNVLLHLDNDLVRLEKLCISMLKCREQWLPYLVPIGMQDLKTIDKLRQTFEEKLLHLTQENITKCLQDLPENVLLTIAELTHFSAKNLCLEFASCDLKSHYQKIKNKNLLHWEHITEILLTEKGTWRKSIDKSLGFPAASNAASKDEKELYGEMKNRFKELLEALITNETLRKNLSHLKISPKIKYEDQEWEIIASLAKILILLVAKLKVLFQQKNIVDYQEIAMNALDTLGASDEPTEVALNWDSKLQHILIDEFQDTSLAQYRLIEKLIAGWQNGDGRTLFIVGDPMQSIYRFRNAEVSLFLKVIQQGFLDIKLKQITLKTNFRSEQTIVDFVNEHFTKIFPKNYDLVLGAIPFEKSTCAKNVTESRENLGATKIKILENGTREDSAKEILSHIQNIQKNFKEDKIAILVRSRNHLAAIIPALKIAKINYTARQFETLNNSEVISDLLMLTRALHSLADRLAWLSILRAPWCGIGLEDLHKIANSNYVTIFEALLHLTSLNLSKDGTKRAKYLFSILQEKIKNRQRENFSTFIKNTWLKILGPAAINEIEFKNDYAALYFDMLDQENIIDFDPNLFEKKLETIYTNLEIEENISLNTISPVTIMTIHQAKGLDFDHVILPGLEEITQSDKNKLLLWQERQYQETNESYLLLAPIKKTSQDKAKLYEYIKFIDKEKTSYEQMRLLYVAITRTRKSVFLIGNFKKTLEEENKKPLTGFLKMLEPCLEENWFIKKGNEKLDNFLPPQPEKIYFKRIILDEQSLKPQMDETHDHTSPTISTSLYVDETSSIIGQTVHLILKKLSLAPLPLDAKIYIRTQKNLWQKYLLEFGLDRNKLESSLKILASAIQNTLEDSRGRWILDCNHQNAISEYPFSVANLRAQNINKISQMFVIDRTFLDENKQRWIVDYKIILSEELPPEEEIKKLHQDQLLNYATIFAAKENENLNPTMSAPRPPKLAIYLPLQAKFIEI